MLTPTQELSTYVYPGSDEFIRLEAEKFCPILKLPNEVLLRIFQSIKTPADLDPLPFVCRLWRNVSKDDSLCSQTRLIKLFLSPEEIERQGLKQRNFFEPATLSYTPASHLFAQLEEIESPKARAAFDKIRYL